MGETRDDLREALARDLTRAAASIESSRTGLGVNGGLVSALGRLTFQNLPLILDALAQVSALQAEVERLQKTEGERGRLERALATSLAFLDMAAGEGLGFVETEDGSPAMEASDICEMIAETIGADINGPIWTALRDAGRKAVTDPQAPSDNPLTETKEGSEHV